MSEDLVPGRSAALQQLLDIYSGVTANSLTEQQTAVLIQELDNYLKLEIEKFLAYPSFEFDWPDYESGLEEVIGGLQDLSEATTSESCWDERLDLAEEGNQRLLDGLALLEQAQKQAEGTQ